MLDLFFQMNQEINRDKSKGELELAAKKIAGFDVILTMLMIHCDSF